MITAEQANQIYQPRIEALLKSMAEVFAKVGFRVDDEVMDMTDDEYSYFICAEDGKLVFSLNLTITEEKVREGEGDGLSFYFNMTKPGGEVLAVLCPFNYTDKVWCRTPEELEDRFRLFTNADHNELVALISRAA